MELFIPGTKRIYKNENAYEELRRTIEITNGLTLGQVCAISSLDPIIIQNWVKRKYVARPINKKYHEKHIARILMINALKDAMRIEDIGNLMVLINGDVDDESDDLISEIELYSLFCKVVYHLDSKDLEKTIKQVLKNNKVINDKIVVALKVMVNAYIASEHKRIARAYLNDLEKL